MDTAAVSSFESSTARRRMFASAPRWSVAGALGIGTAWLVTAHDFPLRRMLAWLLPLPLAVPTYITAYVYVDILDAAGPLQGALPALKGGASPGDFWVPENPPPP